MGYLNNSKRWWDVSKDRFNEEFPVGSMLILAFSIRGASSPYLLLDKGKVAAWEEENPQPGTRQLFYYTKSGGIQLLKKYNYLLETRMLLWWKIYDYEEKKI